MPSFAGRPQLSPPLYGSRTTRKSPNRSQRARRKTLLPHEHTLDLAQFGILRKDDLFKVVFDPGTDKVEKRGLGPAPAFTQGTPRASRLMPTLVDRSATQKAHGRTQPFYRTRGEAVNWAASASSDCGGRVSDPSEAERSPAVPSAAEPRQADRYWHDSVVPFPQSILGTTGVVSFPLRAARRPKSRPLQTAIGTT